jgi:hypothetical protein
LPKSWAIGSGLTLATLGVALTVGSYGLAILAFGLCSVFLVLVYPRWEDTIFARTAAALFLIAEMSFVPSAWTLSGVMATVVNIETLKPAIVYPFVTGLKFIPLLVLVLVYWVVLRRQGDTGFLRNPLLGKTYLGLGPALLLITWLGIATHSNDYRIWQAELPGRWTILIGYAMIFTINIAIWLAARGRSP